MKQKILITAALPYANGPLHFGHMAGAYLPADCYARFQRLMGQEVLYICGSDEYGFAIAMSAELAGRTPRAHVDLFHRINRDFFEKLHISFDHYSRTTWEGHIQPVQQFFLELLENGYIEERVTDQLFAEADQKFLADRYVTGECPRCGFAQARGDECPKCGASYEALELKNPRSKLSGAPLVRRPTKHWFLLLDKFKDRLLDWLSTKEWKPNVIHFIKGYIECMHPRAITRDSNWGVPIPLPGTEGKVLYVWFDAPIGYISATQEWAQKRGEPEKWKDYWCDPAVQLVQFVGKDNIPFHAAIFPAMLMGQNQPYKLVDELPANEFYHLEGRQFSKSDGWFIDLNDFFKTYTSDQIRYAIASHAPETSDSSFTWRGFQSACNSDLLGKYGNLVNRVLVFAARACDGKIPPLVAPEPIDLEFLAKIKSLVDQTAENFAAFRLKRASQLVMELAQTGNVYFDAKHPWKDLKQENTLKRMGTTLHCCMECLKALALIAFPIIPEAASQVWTMLGFQMPLTDLDWNSIRDLPVPAGQQLTPAVILFQKVEDEAIKKEEQMLNDRTHPLEPAALKEATPITPLKPLVEFEDFSKLDLRVGTILEAEPIPKSKRLLKLKVDIGLEHRTVVAGIAEAYTPDSLKGRRVVVVANLKPTALMGVTSEGMLLAGKDGTGLHLLSVESLSPGSIVS